MILENAPLKEEKEETAPESSLAPEPVVKTLEEKKTAIKTTLQEFLHGHTIYDVLPMNGQVLVFNTELPLYEAITALAEHNIFCGVLWDEKKNEFSDLFTIRDIMEIFLFETAQIDLLYPNKGHLITEEEKYINEIVTVMETTNRTKLAPMETEELEKPKPPKPKESEAALQGYGIIFALLKKIKLLDWQRVFGKDKKSPNILINKNLKNSLLEACVEMADKKIHRLAIIEKGKEKDNTTLCGIITHDMIMSYIIANLQGDPSIFDVPVKELSIGTSNPVSASIDSTLYQVLLMMKKKRKSPLYLWLQSHDQTKEQAMQPQDFSLQKI
eukprot:TRINITY_DN11805_c0_g1_i1.p1 TRINITY_DN11805_c0_g1~~TRINITY_DN11805_c0_g1_i1.p1  ORF type:complete len:328 (-),score=74.63 TRINITY_DN11805_c0_g1_i1:209-1192(-)